MNQNPIDIQIESEAYIDEIIVAKVIFQNPFDLPIQGFSLLFSQKAKTPFKVVKQPDTYSGT